MPGYVGRFAPSPTGPLHFGSLVAALASYLDARHVGGQWLLRIEDLDPPRESVTAPGEIRQQLIAHGMMWDGELFQGTRLDAYKAALDTLYGTGDLFHCNCSRKQTPLVYPGTCRDRQITTPPYAVRFRVEGRTVGIVDRLMGPRSWHLETEVGDFIVRRKDNLFAYQLAVVVDDEFQGVTDIVRGADLLDSTPRQLALIDSLQYRVPRYLHIPVLVDPSGEKLSKQAHAAPIAIHDPAANLRGALKVLGQNTQDNAQGVADILAAASRDWKSSTIPSVASIPAPAQ